MLLPISGVCFLGKKLSRRHSGRTRLDGIFVTQLIEAEDGCALVEVQYEELPPVIDPETALDAGTPVIHSVINDNLCFERVHVGGDPDLVMDDIHLIRQFLNLTGASFGGVIVNRVPDIDDFRNAYQRAANNDLSKGRR